MADPAGQDPGDARLVFAAHNNHDERCGRPPRLRNTDKPGLYHGYFENRHGEQFVFTFDQTTGAGTVSGGDLGWDDPKPFTRGLLDEALRSAQGLAARVTGSDVRSKLPVTDAALALGRLTGLAGKDEVIWLRACLEACAPFSEPTEDPCSGKAGPWTPPSSGSRPFLGQLTGYEEPEHTGRRSAFSISLTRPRLAGCQRASKSVAAYPA